MSSYKLNSSAGTLRILPANLQHGSHPRRPSRFSSLCFSRLSPSTNFRNHGGSDAMVQRRSLTLNYSTLPTPSSTRIRALQAYRTHGHESENAAEQVLPLIQQLSKTAIATAVMVVCSLAMSAPALASASAAPAMDVAAAKKGAMWLFMALSTYLRSLWPTLKAIGYVVQHQGPWLVFLLGLSAFFSLAETSITTLWPWKVKELAEKEEGEGVFTILSKDVTRFLTTILIGTTIVNIGATAMVTEGATQAFGEAGVTAATGVMTVLQLLFTEIAPKSIAVYSATEVARVVLWPVYRLSSALYPVGQVCTAVSNVILKMLGLKASSMPFVSEEEIKVMLRGAELSGAIEEEEQDMIENVLEIKDTYVTEVMTPLVNVVAIDAAAPLSEFKSLWMKHQYSRVPVYERRVDNIVGIAYAMDMLDYVEHPAGLPRITVGRVAHKPAFFVSEYMSVWNLLREFRNLKVHMAIVLNEYGGTVGLVTLEDAVEEIVGEIFDESDSREEILKKTGSIIHRGEGIFDVDANTTIEHLQETLEISVPETSIHYETVSGFVCDIFGYIPRMGDTKEVRFKRRESDEEDERDGGEEGQDHHRKNNGSISIQFNVTILAANARRVSAVRFEEIQEEEDAGAKPSSPENRSSSSERESEREREDREREKEREREREKLRAQAWRQERERQEKLRKVTDVVPRPLADGESRVSRRFHDTGGAQSDGEESGEYKVPRGRSLVAESIDVDALDGNVDSRDWMVAEKGQGSSNGAPSEVVEAEDAEKLANAE